MNNIPPNLRAQLAADPAYQTCIVRSPSCDGRITWHHALKHAGKQIQERFAILPVCVFHHLGAGFNEARLAVIAINRATPEDLAKYPNRDWQKEKQRLEKSI